MAASADVQHVTNDNFETFKQGKVGLPAEGLVQEPADHRADHRHQAHPHGDIADHRGGAAVIDDVAHDGARQDHAAGDHRLRHPAGQEHRGVGRGQRAAGGDQEQHQRPQ